MSGLASAHPAPHRDRVRLWVLLFGVIAAPLLWLAQLIVSYGLSAIVCYRGNHPTTIVSATPVRTALLAFDAVALIVGLAAALVAFASWRAVRAEQQSSGHQALDIGEGRTRFMALWGIMSSLCFLGAIIFHTLASIMAPLCVR
ncbi:MAG TPA: hypothetical protein VGH84_11510 [Steroidobacteraceae bacterium]|jgi:uncharacterized membrane protein YeiB